MLFIHLHYPLQLFVGKKVCFVLVFFPGSERRESSMWESRNILIGRNALADRAHGDEVSETGQGGLREEAEELPWLTHSPSLGA